MYMRNVFLNVPEHSKCNTIWLSHCKNSSYLTVLGQVAVTEEERERLLADLQEKASSLERRLEANLSQDEHLFELLKEVRGHDIQYTPIILLQFQSSKSHVFSVCACVEVFITAEVRGGQRSVTGGEKKSQHCGQFTGGSGKAQHLNSCCSI